MISYARQNSEAKSEGASPPAEDHIAPAPRVSVQAFCETVETAAAVQSAGEDRRLAKAHLKIQMGGMAAAIEAYRTAPTPNVIILETEGRNDILNGLDQQPHVRRFDAVQAFRPHMHHVGMRLQHLLGDDAGHALAG